MGQALGMEVVSSGYVSLPPSPN